MSKPNPQVEIIEVNLEKCPKGLIVECPHCGAETKPNLEGHYECWYCKKIFLVYYMNGEWNTV